MLTDSKGGRKGKMPSVVVPVITIPPSMDGIDGSEDGITTVGVFVQAGSQAKDLPDSTEPQGNAFYVRDTNELQTIDEEFNNKLCKEIPGQCLNF